MVKSAAIKEDLGNSKAKSLKSQRKIINYHLLLRDFVLQS
jgi:hypothetical protein